METQALINLSQVIHRKVTDREAKAAQGYPPLDPDSARLLVDDVIRLLYHQELIPRSVLVDHLKILFAFHLARYHLRLMRLLPLRITGEAADPPCGFFLDVAGVPGTSPAVLAERSARHWYARMPEFIQATFTVKKLDDLASHLVKIGKLHRPPTGVFAVPELLRLLGPSYRVDRDRFAESRLAESPRSASGTWTGSGSRHRRPTRPGAGPVHHLHRDHRRVAGWRSTASTSPGAWTRCSRKTARGR